MVPWKYEAWLVAKGFVQVEGNRIRGDFVSSHEIPSYVNVSGDGS